MTTEEITAMLPEAEHHADGEDEQGNETSAPQWEIRHLQNVDGIITAWTNGIEIEGVFYDADEGSIEDFEADALKLLAAIHDHRRFASELAAKYDDHVTERGGVL